MLFSKQTPAAGGTDFAQFDAAWCYDGNGYILNDTGTSLDVRIGASGSVITLASGATLQIKLVFSMAELYVRRTDQSTTQVTVEAQVGTGSAGGGTSAEVGVIAAAIAAATNQAWSTITSTPTTLSGYGITDAQGLDSDLTALAGLSSNGLIARTADGAAATRTITGTANQVIVTNGDGAAGNPTLSLPQSIAATSTPQFSGLRIASSVTVDGGVVSVNANAVGCPTPAIDAWTDNGTTQANISATTYGISGGGIFHGRMARGNQASPSQALAGDIVGGIGGRAWESGTNGFQNSSPASIHFVASENQSSSTRGSYLRFLTTPNGSGTRHERLLITPNGMVVVTDTVADNFNWNTFTGFGSFANDVGLLVMSGVGGERSPNATIATLSTAGSGGTTSGFRGMFAGGTPSAPLATPVGKFLSFLGGAGYNGSEWTATKAGIFFVSSEDWSTTGNGTHISFEATQSGTTNRAQRMILSGDGALRLNAYGAGTLVTDSSGNITASSDVSLKTVTGSFTRGLADVLKLTPRTYHWNAKSGMDTEDENVGFIAQEVLTAVPEAVGQFKTVEVEDKEGKKSKKREAAELLTLSDRPIIAALVNAVKELKAENDALSARIAALENGKAAK